MKALKMLLAGFVFMMSTANYANPSYEDVEKRGTISYEIEQMLSDSGLVIEEDFTVTVFFRVNEDRRIEISSIQSPNEEVNEFLKKRLEKRKLFGDSWSSGKVYELPVKVHGTR